MSEPREFTPAEKAREAKLRQDPIVVIHSPQLVQCSRCERMIKLSTKMAWDPAHWQKHRSRCVKRSEKEVLELKETNLAVLTCTSDVKLARTPPRRRRTASPRTPPSPLSPLTPPPSSDRGLASNGDIPSPLSSCEDLPSAVPSVLLRDPGPTFEEYLLRTRRRLPRDLPPSLLDSWRAWTWAKLKPPFLVNHQSSDMSDDSDDDYTLVLVSDARSDPPPRRQVLPTHPVPSRAPSVGYS
ncbi:uncharacterized protein FIBRA_04636 [Fibroporia radiculosa]|uniref:Uncharacterized protein n=1 Tax=Fibroporia radiculosa TaxID=599839 RepID=J4H325_9APHY|nr:uncharacterized protein FIBRA_04636 [Fibroporia radiculosa]CCM02534.1 predicted protein [Fibroporia radiculosa]